MLYRHKIGDERLGAGKLVIFDDGTGKKINLCGKLSVRETAAVIECAQLFIGHDSGPMHLASAVKTPSVAIFSRHAKPGCWYPLGQHHKVLYPKGKTILSTQVSEVALAVQDILMEV